MVGARLQTLKRRSDFLRARDRGRKWAAPGLVLQARRRGDAEAGPKVGHTRVGYTASRRVGGAVQRNRAKRRLRAAADRVLGARAYAAWDYVLIARKATLDRPFALLVKDLETALRKVAAHRRVGAGEEAGEEEGKRTA